MRHKLAAFVVFSAGTAVLVTSSAQSQLGTFKNSVGLQPTTPGTAQAGHAHVTGTIRASQFVGDGSALSGVDALRLNGLTADLFGIKAAPNTWSSVNIFANPGNVFAGNGSGLTNLNASELSSGFVPSNRLQVPLNLLANDILPLLSVQNNNPSEGVAAIRGTLSTNNAGSFPAAALVGSNFGVSSIAVGVMGTADSGTGVLGRGKVGVQGISDSPSSIALFGLAFGDSTAVRGLAQNPNGVALSATNTVPSGDAARFEGVARFNGNVLMQGTSNLGIGFSSAPVFPLQFASTLGPKVSLWGTNPAAHFGLGIQPSTLQIYSDIVGSSIAFGYGGSASLIETIKIDHGAAELAFRPGGLDGAAGVTSPYDFRIFHDDDGDNVDSWFRVFNSGAFETIRANDGDEAATFFDGAVTANGIDFAEGFKVADPSIEPGDLVVNSGDWEFINRSDKPYQRGVIGVVSTKPAFVAGMSFDAEDKIDPALAKRRDDARRKGDWKLEKELTKRLRTMVEEAYRPVAFMGRVPVKVVGPVKIGDPLTASQIPGVAMAMTQSGHSIGIALEASAGGQRKVMAMIQPGLVSLAEAAPDPALISRIQKLEAENARLRSESQRESAALRERLERLEGLLSQRPR